MRWVGVLGIMAASCAGWSNRDYALEAITSNCNEANPILGECGNRVSVGVYFPIALALHAVVSAILPSGWMRTSWQAVTAGVEIGQITHNVLNPELFRERPILPLPPEPSR
jgi:hypothetical protein